MYSWIFILRCYKMFFTRTYIPSDFRNNIIKIQKYSMPCVFRNIALGTINVNTRLTLVTKKFTLDYNYLIAVLLNTTIVIITLTLNSYKQ